MNISRFFGATNREALRQVRMALGPDALIVSNRRVNGGVEILATDQTSVPEQEQSIPASNARPASPPRPATAPSPYRSAPPTDVMSAIGTMQGVLETRFDELVWGNQLRRAPQAASLFQTLLGLGFSTALLRAMLKRLPANLSAKAALQWARTELVTHLPILKSEDELWVPGVVVALVGPTGVGKTTTIAKLAARCVKRFGTEKVVLLTTDTYRIGAHEQLKIYGKMLHIPVHVVQDAQELKRIIGGIGPRQTILIDNVGISQRDRYVPEQAAMLAQAGRPVSRLLVLNASSHGDTLDEVARSYANDGGSPLQGCIITKMDEAMRLGAVLDTAIRYQLPISYASNGQKVPENLLFLNSADLVDQALAQQPHSHALYAPTEADFAALMSLAKAPADESASAVAEARRQQLLPNLLAAASHANAPLSMPSLVNACAYLDDNLACSESYDLWRGYTTDAATPPLLPSLISHLTRTAQSEAGQAEHRHILAVHDHVTLKSAAGDTGRLRATVLLTDKAEPWVTPVQHLSMAAGWQSSCGLSALVAPGNAEALHQQVDWLARELPSLPLVHVFEGATQAVLRVFLAQGVQWLAQSAASIKVEVDSSPTTLSALAKTLDYHPVDQIGQSLRLNEIAGKDSGNVVLWAGGQTVDLAARNHSPIQVRMVAARLVDRNDGSLIKTLYGLSNLPVAQVSSDALAEWLVAQAEAKTGFRYAARHWQLLDGKGQAQSLQTQALTAMQLGLATWRLMQAPNAQESRSVIYGLAGKRSPTALETSSAMMKLFALKEMLA